MTYSDDWQVESSFDMDSPSSKDQKKRMSEKAPKPDSGTARPTVKKARAETKIVDQSLPNIDKFVGFNPYDTGEFQNKNRNR